MSGIRHGGDQEERRRTGLLRKGEEGHYRWETYLPEDVPKRWLNMGTALREDMRGEVTLVWRESSGGRWMEWVVVAESASLREDRRQKGGGEEGRGGTR